MDHLTSIIDYFRKRAEMGVPFNTRPSETNPTPNTPATRGSVPPYNSNRYGRGWNYDDYDDDISYWNRSYGYRSYSATKQSDKVMSEVNELNDEISNDFEGRGVIILEKLRGIGVRAFFDGKDFTFGNRYATLYDVKESFGAKEVFFRSKYALIKLAEKIAVPFCLFGEMVGDTINKDIPYFESSETKDIFFHDIWLNDNWMNWDDFSTLAKSVNLRIAPMIALENYNEEKIRELAKESSIASYLTKQTMEGIIIRPFIEDMSNYKRLIAKVTNVPYIKPKPAFVPTTVVKPTTTPPATTKYIGSEVLVRNVAESLLSNFCTEARAIYWKHEVDVRKLPVTSDNAYKILSMLVKNSIKDLMPEVELTLTSVSINKKALVKELKRLLPKRIIKALKVPLPLGSD